MTTSSAATLADHYNRLTGKNVKPTSYSKAKFIELINAAANAELITRCGHANCPHCGVHLSNGLLHCDDEAMTQKGAFAVSSGKTMRETGDMTTEWECMGCGEGFGAPVTKPAKAKKPAATLETTDTFTLSELARELNVSPKMARARYRAFSNDHVRTYYIFPRTKEEVARVTKIILPKK